MKKTYLIAILLLLLLLQSCIKRQKLVIKSDENIGRYSDTKTKDVTDLKSSKDEVIKENKSSNAKSELENMYDRMLDEQKSYNTSGVYKVSLLVPLSGQSKPIGQAILDGVKMAMLDSGANNITLFPIDTNAIANMGDVAKQIKEQNVDVVIGPVFSQDTEDLVNSFTKISAPIITMSNNTSLTKYKSVEIFGISPIDKIRMAIKYAKQNGRNNFAALIKSDAGAGSIQKAITDEIKNNKGAFMSLGFYDSSDLRISSSINAIAKNSVITFNIDQNNAPYLINIKTLKKIQESKTLKQEIRHLDVIITDAGGQILDSLLSEMDTIGMLKKDIMIISLSDNVEPGIVNHGVKFITYDRERFDIFKQLYNDAYKTNPNSFAALGYDVMGVLATSFANNNFSYQALHDKSGFVGVSGEFRFGDKNIVERKYSIYEIVHNRIVKIQ